LILKQIFAGERRNKKNQKSGGYTAGHKLYYHHHISIQDGHNSIFLNINNLNYNTIAINFMGNIQICQ